MLVYRVKLTNKMYSLGGLNGECDRHRGKIFTSISMAQRHIINVYNDAPDIYEALFYHSHFKGSLIVVSQLTTVAEEKFMPKKRRVKNGASE